MNGDAILAVGMTEATAGSDLGSIRTPALDEGDHTDTVAEGIALGAVLGVGFGVSGALVSQVYEGKDGAYWVINGANAVIAYAIVGAILAVWN